MEEQKDKYNSIFESYETISDFVKENSIEEILVCVCNILNSEPEAMSRYPMGMVKRDGNKATYYDCLTDLKENIDKYCRVYDRLSDAASKNRYMYQMAYRLLPNKKFLTELSDDDHMEFSDVETVDKDEIKYIIENRNSFKDGETKLSISIHHTISDMWEIPLLISRFLPNNDLRIFRNKEKNIAETMLYSAPKRKKRKNALKTTVTIMPQLRYWKNVELIKDCGLIPYLLHKDHGMEATMVGFPTDLSGYTNRQYVEGMNYACFEHYDIKVAMDYLIEHAKDIDLLILRGGYPICADMARVYKIMNPEGLIYCGLDANSYWMDRIKWYEPGYKWFIDNTDIITTSCTAMADHLTQKWHRKIDVVYNGYYDFYHDNSFDCSFEDKENVILTSARIGAETKRTDFLMRAFAMIADSIPDWTLRLAGPIEGSFKLYIDDYFETYPHLKDRVIFLGNINDRKCLIEEYKKAKIFALTSILEGAPNVITEALASGCTIAVSEFDAYEDCIDRGRCGSSAKIGDVHGFAGILLKLIQDPDLKEKSERAREYAKKNFDMKKIVDDLYARLSELREDI